VRARQKSGFNAPELPIGVLDSRRMIGQSGAMPSTTWWGARAHPKLGLVVTALGLLIAFWSIWPWAQRPNDPTQAVYAGQVGDQRTLVLLLGLVVAFFGAAVDCLGWRLLFVASAIAALGVLFVARGAVQDVQLVTADDADIVSEVGWALYWIEVAAIVCAIASVFATRRTWRRSGGE
jgi:hypothetical protein